MGNPLAQRVEETLTPVIGTVLAAVSVDVESKRIGKTPDTLEDSDLSAMSQGLATALRLVVGPEMADAAARKVRDLA